VGSPSLSSLGSGHHPGGSTTVNQSETQYSPSIPASSPTIDSHFNQAHHQIERQSSISGEQQHEMNGLPAMGTDHDLYEGLSNLSSTFTSNERRRPEPRYYVGEVFRHLIYRYTGVIYGYDLSKYHEIRHPFPLKRVMLYEANIDGLLVNRFKLILLRVRGGRKVDQFNGN
jgi:hypothetical protein